MSSFSFADRQSFISQFSQDSYDLAIIGGGITGAGVARDAASRGMKVALVEAGDFAVGTSSRSSKLIHGGIRYLENLEFGLVFEALRERRLLAEMAPHLVHPLRFLLPLYEGGRVGMLKMGLGMWLYDALALFEAPEMHERLSKVSTLGRFPVLKEKGLLGSYLYSDAYMDDDRLVLETLRSAVKLGAQCVNYVQAIGLENPCEGGLKKLVCRDGNTGTEFSLTAKHIVSSVGPWTDEVAELLVPEWRPIMRPSKGVHLTLSRDRLPLSSAVVMAADQEERIVFAIPRHEMVIIGTTDSDYEGDPREVHTEPDDVSYLIKVVDEYFPGARICREDIISSYAGVRPLVDDGSSSEGKTSREHLILHHPSGVTFVTGGKYTTYRHMAEETVAGALGFFSYEDQALFARNKTEEPLNELVSRDSYDQACLQTEELAKSWGVPEEVARHFILRHGMEAESLVQLYLDHFAETLVSCQPERIWRAEALFAIQNTLCFHLDDFILRRTPLFLAEKDHGASLIPILLATFGEAFGWDNAKCQLELKRFENHCSKELLWQKGGSIF